MNPLCLAMILATRPAIVYAFLICCMVWVRCSLSTYVFHVFSNESRDAPRYRLRIYYFSLCLGKMFTVNICIPYVW